MLIIGISIFLLVTACISYKKDPTASKRSGIMVLTIIDSVLTGLYILAIAFVAVVGFAIIPSLVIDPFVNAELAELVGFISTAGFGLWILLLAVPCAFGAVATIIGYRAYYNKNLYNNSVESEKKEQQLQNTQHKFCKSCGTCSPYYVTICKHCEGTEFQLTPPEISLNSGGIIPQQLDDKLTNKIDN